MTKELIYEIKKYSKSKIYIFSIFLGILLSLFFVFLSKSNPENIFSNYLGNICNLWFSFCLLILILINSIKIFNEIKYNNNYICRFKNKKDAYINFFKVIVILNTFLLLICYVFPFILLLITKTAPVKNIPFVYYKGVKYFIYIAFFVLRCIFILNLLVCFYFVICLIFNNKYALIMLIVILFDLTLTNLYISQISNLIEIKLQPKYYLYPIPYTSFFLEISMSIFYISLLFIILNLLLIKYETLKKDN